MAPFEQVTPHCAHASVPVVRQGRRSPSPLRRNLRFSLIEGIGAAVMVGVGETYLSAFALATGMGQVAAGLVTSVPLLAGALLQLGAPLLVMRLGSYKKWIVACVAAQAACFLPLMAAAIHGAIPPWAVFLLAAAYWATSMAVGPTWNAWIATIVPPRIRPRYFSRRSRWAQLAVLIGILGGGAILHYTNQHDVPFRGFAIIFAIAAFARFISSRYLAISQENVPPRRMRLLPAKELLRRMRSSNDGRLLLFMIVFMAGVQFSGPYFTPYMLRQLELSYAQYMGLLSISFSAKALTLPLMGHLAQRFGARRVVSIGAFGIVPLAAMWVPTNEYAVLIGIQVLSGIAWGAYELGSFLLLFETIPDEERTSMLTAFNVGSAVSMVVASIAGGAVIGALGASPFAYHVVFACSTLIRGGAVLLLSRVKDMPITMSGIATRTDAVQPSTGSMERPLVVSISKSWLGVLELGERGRRALIDLVRPSRRD
jgi:MFS family permease